MVEPDLQGLIRKKGIRKVTSGTPWLPHWPDLPTCFTEDDSGKPSSSSVKLVGRSGQFGSQGLLTCDFSYAFFSFLSLSIWLNHDENSYLCFIFQTTLFIMFH
jgi:hypothetical protein